MPRSNLRSAAEGALRTGRLGRLCSELQALSAGGVARERGWISRGWLVALATTWATLFLGWPKLGCAQALAKHLVLRAPGVQPAAWSPVETEEPARACALVAGSLNGTLAALDIIGSAPVFRYRIGLAELCSVGAWEVASYVATRLVYVAEDDQLFVVLRPHAVDIATCREPRDMQPPGVVDVYQATSMRRVRRFAPEAGAGEGFELAGNGAFYSAGQGRLLAVDVATGEVRREARYEGTVTALALNAQGGGELLVGVDRGGVTTVSVVDADTLGLLREWALPLPAGPSGTRLHDMVVSPDGVLLHVLTGWPNRWALATLSGEIVHRLELGDFGRPRLLLAPASDVAYVVKVHSGLPEKYQGVVKIDVATGNQTAAWVLESNPSRWEYEYAWDLQWGPEQALWVSGFTGPARTGTAWLAQLDPTLLEPRRTLSFGTWRDGGMLAMLPFSCPELRPVTCDCDTDGTVTVDEVVRAVLAAVETLPTWACPMADQNGDDKVTIEELVAGVNCMLGGCS